MIFQKRSKTKSKFYKEGDESDESDESSKERKGPFSNEKYLQISEYGIDYL